MNNAQAIELAIQKLQRGELGEAEALYRQVLATEPNNADALHMLGVIAYQTARLDMAIECFQRVIQLRPLMAEAHNSLASAYRAKGLPLQAVAACRNVVRLRENDPEAHFKLGALLREAGCADQAVDSYRKALELRPGFADAATDLGSALREAGRLDEAVTVLEQTVQQAPFSFKAHNNLGNALRVVGRLDEAEAALRTALQLRDDIAEIHVNLGHVLLQKGQLAGAIAATRQALRLRPDMADVHHNLGSILLLAGEYAEGWRELEWRWRCRNFGHMRSVPGRPRWDGSNLNGQTILLQSEAGLGDALHLARYIPMVADRGGQIVLECQKGLHPLLRNLKGVRQLITEEDPLPSVDVHCSLMSLPLAFNTTLQTIPAEVPYLAPEECLVKQWAQRLSAYPGPRVGLVWAGNPGHTHDRTRSLQLAMLAPLAAAGDITFHSLQVGDAARQMSAPPEGLKLIDHSRELTDFAETAALVTNLDLLISVDTSVAHLAGALGKAVWLMQRVAPDWRWMLVREDSPWYPTMRLFRQTTLGQWDDVIQRVADELTNFYKDAIRHGT
jgi:tetratricopeptide (TPR) repeat protein